MRISAKDMAAGLFLILVALAGLYINGGFFGIGLEEHSLGSARRMGPGYMPMLVFWLLMLLGLLVVAFGFVSGPDPLQKWTGIEIGSFVAAIVVGLAVWYISPAFGSYFEQTYNGVGLGALVGFLVLCFAAGWQMIGFVLAAMCIFALLLEQGGLMFAIIGTVVISTVADPDHRARPLGVIGVTVFLLGLCWWIFIRELDIRVAVWPWSY